MGKGFLPRVAAVLGLWALAPLALADPAQAPSAESAAARLKAMNVAFVPERLVQFAGQGDAAVVGAFLEAGMPPDSTEPRRGATALIHAAANGHARIVARLLDAGASPNRPDNDGTTPLTAACYFGKADVVKTLLARGADARSIPKDGAVSALDAAIGSGNPGIVKWLLAAGADAVGESREVPPLARAAYAGRVEMLGLLLETRPPQAVVRRALEAARLAGHENAEALLSKALAP